MKLKNHFELILRESTFKKAKGLMFSKKIKNQAHIFKFKKQTKISVHMFFVFQQLDIITLNKKNEILELKTLKPFQTHTFKQKSDTFIELPSGTIKKYSLKKGKKIIL